MSRWRWAAALVLAVLPVAATADTPMTIAATGHITVPVTVEGRGPFPFVLDTGAEGTAVYDRFAAEQRLVPDTSEPMIVTGQTGQATATAVRLAQIGFDGVTAKHVLAVRLPDRADGVALAGIVGLDVFGDRILTIDYRRMRARLQRTGSVVAPRRAIQASRIVGGLLTIPVRVNGRTGTAVVDTGARETRINTAFAKLAAIVPDPAATTVTVHGATNTAATLRPATARAVTIGTMELGRRRVLVGDLPVFASFGVADRPAMILGSDYFAGRRLTVDFPRALVWVD